MEEKAKGENMEEEIEIKVYEFPDEPSFLNYPETFLPEPKKESIFKRFWKFLCSLNKGGRDRE